MVTKSKPKSKPGRNLDVFAAHGYQNGDGKHHVYYGDFSFNVNLKPKKFPGTKQGWDDALFFAEKKAASMGLKKMSVSAPDYKGKVSVDANIIINPRTYRKVNAPRITSKSPHITPKMPRLR